MKLRYAPKESIEKGNAVSNNKRLHGKRNEIFGEQWIVKFVGMGTEGALVMQDKKGGFSDRSLKSHMFKLFIAMHIN